MQADRVLSPNGRGLPVKGRVTGRPGRRASPIGRTDGRCVLPAAIRLPPDSWRRRLRQP